MSRMSQKSRPSTAAPSRPKSNTDFQSIIKELCAPEYVASGLNWLNFINDKEKQGLRILQAVMKHRGMKKFRNKPKESITEIAQKSIGTKSFLHLSNDALGKYAEEYKKNMYKSAYGVAFGRKETDIADTGILKYKKFSELQCAKILDSTAKAFITRWADSGEENSYISLAILVVKGIFTHWKKSLPNETVSHLKHAWYDPHDVVHNQRMDQIGKTFLMSRITKATTVERPQTTGNLLRRKHKSSIFPVKKDDGKKKGIDDIINNRKKFLLRGNGNITGFYNDPSGNVSSYQSQFKACKSTKAIQRTAGKLYTSSIMTVTPDPLTAKKEIEKHTMLRTSLNDVDKRLTKTNTALQRAVGRALNYNDADLSGLMKNNVSHINLGRAHPYQLGSNGGLASQHRTPMPVRVQNLMENGLNTRM